MTARVAIDLNVRVAGNETFVGFEDFEGPIVPGAQVEVVEPESNISGPGRVSRIDAERRLVYLAVSWSELRQSPPEEQEQVDRPEAFDVDQAWGPGLHSAFKAIVSQVERPVASESPSCVVKVLRDWGVTPHLPGGAYYTSVHYSSNFSTEQVCEGRAAAPKVEVR